MDENEKSLSIFFSIDGGTPAQIARAMETLSNIATGLALDGLSVHINIEQEVEWAEFGDSEE